MSAGKKALAVVRCGDASLHESWAANQTAVDLAISYFGDDADRQFPGQATFIATRAGSGTGYTISFWQILRPQVPTTTIGFRTTTCG